MQPLAKSQLDKMPCSECGSTSCEDLMHFTGKCHPGAPVKVTYKRGSGYLQITCAVCGQVVCEVAVKTDFRLN
jgi:hypothetical protein